MRIKLMYVSQGRTKEEQLTNIKSVLDAGCKWIQLRFKNADNKELAELAAEVKKLCAEKGAVFIINDHIDLAREIDADGVHLGLLDEPVQKARAILGNSKIIGGTANTYEDVMMRINEKCDYIGLGPFRFTSTKDKLSPVLGVQGITDIMQQLPPDLTVPVFAIGGITHHDVEEIMGTGVFGVAVSGALTYSEDKKEMIRKFNVSLYEEFDHSGERI